MEGLEEKEEMQREGRTAIEEVPNVDAITVEEKRVCVCVCVCLCV